MASYESTTDREGRECAPQSSEGQRSFFHRSNAPLEIGTILVGRGLTHNIQDIEDEFEKRRPAHC
jgi:hypothetical protein